MEEKRTRFTYQDRVELKEALSQGFSLEYLANNSDFSYHAIRKEVKAGLKKEDEKLYGRYDIGLAVYTRISSLIDDDSIDAFVKWWKERE